MNRVRTPFNINRLAQCAALAAWSDTAYVADSVKHAIRERERMRDALTTMGYACAPSLANFLFFDAREDADALAQRLMRAGVIVKPWREPGFTRCVRVSSSKRSGVCARRGTEEAARCRELRTRSRPSRRTRPSTPPIPMPTRTPRSPATRR
jgi:hypothetical protein